MMRERLKELDIRITELCDYLHFSRPTMYRFIENYEEGKFRGVDKSVLKVFKYIDETPNIGKKNVISFIINNVQDNCESKDSLLVRTAKTYESGKIHSDEKDKFLIKLMTTSEMDDLVNYFLECDQILSKEELSDDDYQKVGRYILMWDNLEKNTKLTSVQIQKVKKIIEG